MMRHLVAAFSIAVLSLALLALPSNAQETRILATVNDKPITTKDVSARLNLWKVLGRQPQGNAKRMALNSIIDDMAKVEETRKAKAEPTSKEIEERLGTVAKGLGTDRAGLKDKLKSQGITLSSLELYVSGQIAFSRLIFGKYKEKVEVEPGEVDAKMAQIKAQMDSQVRKMMADPRMKGAKVYELLEVSFPVDLKDPAADSLLSSRFVEAQQYLSRFKGCKSARAAAEGIFNVKVGKPQQADGAKLPPAMKAEFDKRGRGSAIGPFRSQNGIQIWAYCGFKDIKPQLPEVKYPTRDQIEGAVMNEKFAKIEAKYGPRFRDSVIIEYIDQSYAQ